MLKSSGSSYLISGANKTVFFQYSSQIIVTATWSIYFMREFSLTFCFYLVRHTETSMLRISAPYVFKDQMIRSSAIHIAYRILAAFFIVMGTKTSIVENLN
jgi:hypothetical protein